MSLLPSFILNSDVVEPLKELDRIHSLLIQFRWDMYRMIENMPPERYDNPQAELDRVTDVIAQYARAIEYLKTKPKE